MVSYKKLTIPFKLLSAYLVFALLYYIVNDYAASRYHSNVPVLHVISLANYIFFALIYYYLLKSKLIKKAILLSIILVTLFSVINAIFFEPFLKVFPANLMLSTDVLFVILSLLLFKQMLLYPLQINIIKQGIFWFNTAILFFSTTMFVNFALVNYYRRYHIYNLLIVLYFWDLTEFIFIILLGIAVFVHKKEINQTGK